MASTTYQRDDLRHFINQRRLKPKSHFSPPNFIIVELTITLQLKLTRHYCLTDQFIDLVDERLQETRSFNLNVLKNSILTYHTVAPMLRSLGVQPGSPMCIDVINEVIEYGLEAERRLSVETGTKVLPLHLQIWRRDVEQVDHAEEMERILEESAREIESSNYNMIPAKESSIKKMLKRVRVEAQGFDQSNKKRRVKGDDCVICLKELKVGSDASRMPCSHTFHGDCIEKWLKQSHYCPVCRFEMPTD